MVFHLQVGDKEEVISADRLKPHTGSAQRIRHIQRLRHAGGGHLSCKYCPASHTAYKKLGGLM